MMWIHQHTWRNSMGVTDVSVAVLNDASQKKQLEKNHCRYTLLHSFPMLIAMS